MTNTANSRRIILLIAGDLIAYLFSLILTLTVRYGHLPGKNLLYVHLVPFSILFVIFIIVGLSIGLYDKRAVFVRGKLAAPIMQMQIINVLIGIAFFYLAPLAIAPKVNLIIYFIISTCSLYLWRGLMFPVVVSGRKQGAVIIGSGDDVDALYAEINADGKYGMVFRAKLAPGKTPAETEAMVRTAMRDTRASVLVADLRNPAIESTMSSLYSLIFSGTQIIDASSFYESVFDRIPLSIVGERWLVENSSVALGTSRVYDALKRVMDIFIGSILGIISLIFYPFLYIAIKLDDHGTIFVVQERIGKNGQPIRIAKFRSMTANDAGSYGNGGKSAHKVTRVGKFIRMTRIDELPQLWSIVRGDQSLIGPRPELPALVNIYEKEVPYYNARHLVKPGLSGWAQIYHRAHPHHAVAVDDTRDKLSYDLFYVKNRSFMLDLKIALQTLRALVSRQGV